MRRYPSTMTVSHPRRLLATAGMAGMIAAALLHPAPAYADELTYLDDLKAAGFDQPTNGNAGMIEGGHSICRALGAGNSPDKVAQYVYENSHLGSLDDARQLVGIARQDLCPDLAVTPFDPSA